MEAMSSENATGSKKEDGPGKINSKSKRNYRSKKQESDNELENDSGVASDTITSSPSGSGSTTSKAKKAPSTLAYVESQNSQNIAEVYPGLARLSFLDQEQHEEYQLKQSSSTDISDRDSLLGARQTRRPLQQAQTATPEAVSPEFPTTPFTTLTDNSLPAPTMSTPSSISSGSNPPIFEIRDTGLDAKGRGIFSTSTETLRPGTLVFKELGYCSVVSDASLPFVCSACFKDTRDDQENERTSELGDAPSTGLKKLVRCAGCKVVWYCNRTCQVRDWNLHHQLECQGIQKSLTNPMTKEIWAKRTVETTTCRAICRLVRRRERVKASAEYKTAHGKMDGLQKKANEIFFSGLDQKEELWLDEHGSDWIDRYLNTYEHERSTQSKGVLDESSQLTKVMALVMSCVVSPKEDRHAFMKGGRLGTASSAEAASSAGGFDIIRKLNAYGFAMTNLETTTVTGLGLYIQSMAFMNHSCVPNCIYTFRGARVECRVIRDIKPGEEMTVSYIDQIGTTRERQKQLQEQYLFKCDCPLCRFYPANPLVPSDTAPLMGAYPELSAKALQPTMDRKQGYVCPNRGCTGTSQRVLAIDSQLAIYNTVELVCSGCNRTTELTQERVEENQEDFDRLLSGFVREMTHGSRSLGGSKPSRRNFELAKVFTEGSTGETTSPQGGMATVQEPSAWALQYFKDAQIALSGNPDNLRVENLSSNEQFIKRHGLHHLIRRLEQVGFDEAISNKHWVFALHRSINLEGILNDVYVGHHPRKAVQGYYTCKIANLLANLLLEESTIEIEEEEKGKEDEDMEGDSDDERDLSALRAAMGGKKDEAPTKLRKTGSTHDTTQEKALAASSMDRKRVQKESSRELLQCLKSLLPKIEDPNILQQFRICWGKDGKLASRYRNQADSLKQALHYAELPFLK